MTMLNGQPIGDPAPKPTVAAAPQPVAYPDSTNFVLGIMSLIFAFVVPIVGAILGGIALSQAKRAGTTNTVAKVGFILGLVFTILIVIGVVVGIIFGVGLFSELFRVCQQLGEGTHQYNGVTYTCS